MVRQTQARGAATTGVLVVLGGWLSAEAVHFRRGDVNADGQLTLTDPVVLLEHLFRSGDLPCRDAGDWNDDGKLDLGDAVNALSFLFLGGVPAPEKPGEACGADYTLDELDCAEFPVCDQPLERDWTVREVNGFGRALALDSAANIYVTGETWGGATNSDYITLKYDSEGHELWRRQFDLDSNAESAGGLDIDAAGNAYVIGDAGSVKYDSRTGEELWARPFHDSSRFTSSPEDLVVNSGGNLHVTGFRTPPGGSASYMTIKYDPSGQEIWAATYPSSGATAYAYAMVLDVEGNVFVTGQAYSPGSGSDYATVKYDPDGKELWVALFDGGGKSADGGRALIVGPDGSSYVTGDSGVDSVTIRYASDGRQLWATRFRPEGRVSSLTETLQLDAMGNTYAGGGSTESCQVGSRYCIFIPLLLKLDPAGIVLWAREHAIDPESGGQVVTAISLDPEGNAYAATRGPGMGVILKYSPEGDPLYAVPWLSASTIQAFPHAMALDASGHIYLAGFSYGDHITVDANPVPILTVVRFTER